MALESPAQYTSQIRIIIILHLEANDMNSSWQAFIQQRILKTPAVTGAAILSPLPPTAVLNISGEDAQAFLQGQTSCDMHRITPACSGLGAFCNPHGRVIATFQVLRDERGFRLLLAADLLEKVVQRLRLYVLRSKVEIAADDLALFGVTTAKSGMLQKILEKPSQTSGAVIQAHRLHWLRMPPPGERWLVLGNPEAAQAAWLRLVEALDAAESPATYWQLQDIRAGLPTVTAATSEEFLPQMLNLDRLGGISFNKGCYTGQEVIARTHYRGQVKRRLYRVRLSSPHTPAPGAKLVAEDETVGQVVNAAPTDSGQEILAVVRCDQVHSSAVWLAGYGDTPLQWLELAYT